MIDDPQSIGRSFLSLNLDSYRGNLVIRSEMYYLKSILSSGHNLIFFHIGVEVSAHVTHAILLIRGVPV